MTLRYCLASLHFNLQDPLYISCREGLVVINSLSFCFPIFLFLIIIFHSFLKHSFARYRILGWQFIFFSGTLSTWSYCLLTYKAAAEKSADNFIENLLCRMINFSVVAFNILSLSCKSLIRMCLGIVSLSLSYLELIGLLAGV